MRILYFSADQDAPVWVPALQAAWPTAQVAAWESGAAPADYVVVWKPPQQLFDEQHGVRAIFNTGAGVDALLRLRLPAGVPVIRLDDAGMGVQMAEYVCQAVIRHYRELDATEADMRQGRWAYRAVRERAAFGVGVMGLGVLGERVARALQAFEFPVRGWSRTPKSIPGVQCFAGAEQLAAFAAGCRVLVCLLPLTAQTENIINADLLAQLPAGSYVVNVARGAHVVDADLLAALNQGHLAAATLDVFRTEPLPAEHPFWSHPRITLTPHTSARTLRDESIAQIVRKINALERGEAVAGRVDAGRGY
jgi:glyoxylate/hydroxypyruvate reductase